VKDEILVDPIPELDEAGMMSAQMLKAGSIKSAGIRYLNLIEGVRIQGGENLKLNHYHSFR